MEPKSNEKIEPDSELSAGDVDQLLSQKLLSGQFVSPSEGQGRIRLRFFSAIRADGEFLKWTGIWSGMIGATLLLLGILFFFASNWKEMSPTLRLGALQGSVGISTLFACVFGVHKTLGRWLLVASTVITGVLLAVFGQTFQNISPNQHKQQKWIFGKNYTLKQGFY